MLKKFIKAIAGVVVSAVVAVGEVPFLAGAAAVDAARVIRKADEVVEHDLMAGPVPVDNVKPGSAIKGMWRAFGVFWDDIYDKFFN
jgi:hypothetical protein